MSKLKIEIGHVFNDFTIVNELPRAILPSGQTNRMFLCRCKCGKEKKVRLGHLNHNKIKDCGCSRSPTSGESGSLLAKIWRAMNDRCKPESYAKKWYYDRGIKVCKEWAESFWVFKKWCLENGYAKGLHIDRRDNSKGYSPENCRWVTPKVNANNKDNNRIIEYNGKKMTISDALSESNSECGYFTAIDRIKRGWSGQDAIDKPVRKGNYRRNKNTMQ